MKYLFFILFFTLFCISGYSTIYETKQDGHWVDSSIWMNGQLPTDSDSIIIKHHITFSVDLSFQPGAYLIIDTSAVLCGYQQISFVCGAYLYNYGTLKASRMILKDSWNYGKIHLLSYLQISPCYNNTKSGGITVGIPFDCVCSIPLAFENITNSDGGANGGAEITIDNVLNENLVYSYSIDGVNYQSSNLFTGLFPGDYPLYIKDDKGCVTKESFYIKEVIDIIIKAYPNPFTEVLNITLKGNLDNQLKIYDSLGRIVYSNVLYGNDTYTIQTDDFISKGVYFLDVRNSYKHVVYKLVKQ